MNIDSSSLLSLLSSDISLEKIQQTIEVENDLSQTFADTFLEKTKQINGLNKGENIADNFTINFSENTDKLHGLADWLNEKSTAVGFSRLFGKDLPKTNKFENDIDLENTLESLANVMLVLEEVELNSDEIQTKLTTAVEKVEAIKTSVSDQIELGEKLSKLVHELQDIKEDTSKTFEIKIANQLQEIGLEVEDSSTKLTNEGLVVSMSNLFDESKLVVSEKPDLETSEKRRFTQEKFISAKVQKEKQFNIKKPVIDSSDNLNSEIPHVTKQQLQEKGFFLSDNLATRIDEVVASIKQIEDSLSEYQSFDDLESQLESLASDVISIKEFLYQPLPVKLDSFASNKNMNIQFDKTDIRNEVDEAVQLENQNAAIATTLIEPLKQEKIGAESNLIGQLIQEDKSEIKKEMLSLKQMAEERALTITTKDQATILQQDNAFTASVEDKPVLKAIQNEKVELLETKDLDQDHDKGVLKFISDFSNLNKSIMLGNKAEISPMDKHFAHPEWNKEFGERVIWMYKQTTPSAELRLNPKHLGPITIKLDVTQDQVTVAFSAQHVAVKEAIDAAIPKLREMFSAQQLNLVDVNVSQENLDQRHSRGYPQMWGEQRKSDGQDAENETKTEQTNNVLEVVDEIESARAIASNGILSIYA